MEKQRELQLLPPSSSSSAAATWLLPPPPEPSTSRRHLHIHKQAPDAADQLDLQLSISPLQRPSSLKPPQPPAQQPQRRQVEALRWQAAEQIRMAAMEKAYAERVRELTRREMELAQAELARARIVWERARDDVARAELLKENAQVGSMEITCHSCRHRFRPYRSTDPA